MPIIRRKCVGHYHIALLKLSRKISYFHQDNVTVPYSTDLYPQTVRWKEILIRWRGYHRNWTTLRLIKTNHMIKMASKNYMIAIIVVSSSNGTIWNSKNELIFLEIFVTDFDCLNLSLLRTEIYFLINL